MVRFSDDADQKVVLERSVTLHLTSLPVNVEFGDDIPGIVPPVFLHPSTLRSEFGGKDLVICARVRENTGNLMCEIYL